MICRKCCKEVNPEKTTLFLVASKTFTTQETMTNAHSQRATAFLATGGRRQARGETLRPLSHNRGKARLASSASTTAKCSRILGTGWPPLLLWSASGLSIILSWASNNSLSCCRRACDG
ncbi:hypothetical protein LAD77_01650 [Klebsiella pneumoniae]|nr:hypothetical protein [Klebsiella pneumoniae]